jgi:hypothetical protein
LREVNLVLEPNIGVLVSSHSAVLFQLYCRSFIPNTMGRPSWANEAQWLWLTTQATEYMKIKGNKKETAKFGQRIWTGGKVNGLHQHLVTECAMEMT